MNDEVKKVCMSEMVVLQAALGRGYFDVSFGMGKVSLIKQIALACDDVAMFEDANELGKRINAKRKGAA